MLRLQWVCVLVIEGIGKNFELKWKSIFWQLLQKISIILRRNIFDTQWILTCPVLSKQLCIPCRAASTGFVLSCTALLCDKMANDFLSSCVSTVGEPGEALSPEGFTPGIVVSVQ